MSASSSFYKNTGPVFQGENPTSVSNYGEIVATIDNSNLVISTGFKGDYPITFGCTINSVMLVSDVSGSVVIDILKAPFGTTPTASICGSTNPTLSAATTYRDTALVGWNTAITPLDVLRIQVVSVSTITRLTIVLQITKG
jgi:hypothetical protein